MFQKQKAHLIHWIAILSIAMASFAPAISQAVSVADHGKGLSLDICSASGQKVSHTIDLSSDTKQESQEACAYCVVHAGFVLLIHDTLNFSLHHSPSLYSEVLYQSPNLVVSWISLPSRAPPQS